MTMTAELPISETMAQQQAIGQTFDLFAQPGACVELRVPKGQRLFGFFEPTPEGREAFIREASRLSDDPSVPAVYVTMNLVDPKFLNNVRNHTVKLRSGSCAKDKSILARKFLLVDCDVQRAKDTNATDAEKAAAQERAEWIRHWLPLAMTQPWPEPIVCDSGNGWHLLYDIDLPTDDGGLVDGALKSLKEYFSDEVVKVDTSVSNASRVTKCYGTMVRKGPHSAERPHRRSAIVEIPQHRFTVTEEQLKELAELAKPRVSASEWDDRRKMQWALERLSQRRCDDYEGESWINVGMAIHAAGGTLEEWVSWSRKSDRFEDGACEKRWKGFNTGGGLTLGSLIQWAKEDSGEIPPWAGNREKRQAVASHEPRRPENRLQNFELVAEPGQKAYLSPKPITSITQDLFDLTGNWPRRVEKSLFALRPDGTGVDWLETQPEMLAWIGRITGEPPNFVGTAGFHRESVLMANLQHVAQSYVSVETLPHEPKLPGRFYACESPQGAGGRHLSRLLAQFSPATEADRALITTLFLSPLWGGGCGSRPCYVITAPQVDGCGSGKTATAKVAGWLFGGTVDISATEKIVTIKERLLSPDALTKRIVLLDNVKVKLNWPDGESLITAASISGKRMYVGNATRPNDLTWMVTANGAALSTDWAQRSIVIRMNRPQFGHRWEVETQELITAHRDQIIGDLLEILRRPVRPPTRPTRWARWVAEVLGKVPGVDLQAVEDAIASRSREADAEAEEAEVIAAFFTHSRGTKTFIPSQTAAEWLRVALNERNMSTVPAGKKLRALCDAGKIPYRWKHTKQGNGLEYIEAAVKEVKEE